MFDVSGLMPDIAGAIVLHGCTQLADFLHHQDVTMVTIQNE